MTTLLSCQQLDVSVGQRLLTRALDLHIADKQCWVILGPNGVGKTRLLRQLSGLDKAARTDAIQLCNQPIQQYPARKRAQWIGLVMQHSRTGFQQTVLDAVLSGRYPHHISHFRDSPDAIRQAHQTLARLGIGLLAERPLQQLSGGELRRVEIARLWVQNPRIAMLDEPLNHLDIRQQIQMLHLLKERFTRPQQALILVLHDLNLARQIATHCLLLFGDGTWQAGPVGQIATRANFSRLMDYPLIEYRAEGASYLGPKPVDIMHTQNGAVT